MHLFNNNSCTFCFFHCTSCHFFYPSRHNGGPKYKGKKKEKRLMNGGPKYKQILTNFVELNDTSPKYLSLNQDSISDGEQFRKED